MDAAKTGHLIRQARIDKGLTQKQLAGQLHISDRTVSKWERGAGLPDIALLEPLADALGLTVQGLLRGEAAAEPSAEQAVRIAVKLVATQTKQTLRRNLSRVLATMFLLAFFAFFLFAALEYSGAFLRPVHLQVPAAIYQNGTKIGETTATIDGSLHTLYNRNFQGTFSLPEAPGSAQTQVSAFIRWAEPEQGFQTIQFFRPGLLTVEAGIEPYLYISPDMTQFAVSLSDGRIAATHEGLAALQRIEGYRYALDYTDMPLFGYWNP